MQQVSLCVYCKYLHEGLPRRCVAYPDGVPRAFAVGKDAHLAPAEGDHGIQFEERLDLPPASRKIVQMIREAYEFRQQKASATDKGKDVRPAG